MSPIDLSKRTNDYTTRGETQRMINASAFNGVSVADADKFPKGVMVWTGDHWVTQNVIEAVKGDPKNPFPSLITQGLTSNSQIIQTGANFFAPNGSTQFFTANYPVAMTTVISFVFSVNSTQAIQWTQISTFNTVNYTVQALTSAAAFIPSGQSFTVYWAAFGN